MRNRQVFAAALWFVLAFLVWNIRFDFGVRATARSYLNHRALYLRDAAPRVEMAAAMCAGIRDSARAAMVVSLPFTGVAVWLAATRLRRFNGISES